MLNLEKLTEMNGWWKTNHVREELLLSYKRRLFFEIKDYIKIRQIIGIIGLRRVGKTTILYQLIEHLIDNGVKPENILFFSFDESIEELKELFDVYQENIIKKELSKEKIYIFLDEIQKLKNWRDKIKIYYDLYPNIKFFVSGSASLNLIVGAKESLAGRIFYFNLDLLSFREFLELKGKDIKKIKENINLWKRELKIELKNYLLRPFPEIISFNDDIAKRYIKESVIDKAIFKDLSIMFEIKDIELIDKLIHLIAEKPGLIINLEDISKDFGRSRQVISNYLYYLQFCFVIRSLRNFRGSFKSSSRKLKKYYLSHPCLSLVLASPKEGELIENLSQFIAKADFFWNEQNKEVDFIIFENKKIIPVEVKYIIKVKLKEVNNLLKFMKKYDVKEGIVVTEDYEGEEKIEDKIIKLIPLWKWLLE